jgi:hypothetical protein
MTKQSIAAIVLIAGGLSAAVAAAQGLHGGPPGHERLGMNPFAAVMSAEQKQALYSTMKADRSKLQALHERLHKAREALMEKLLSANATVDVSQQTAELKAAYAAMIDERVEIAMAARKLLNPQQLKDAAAFHAKLQELHRQEDALVRQMQGGKGNLEGGDE